MKPNWPEYILRLGISQACQGNFIAASERLAHLERMNYPGAEDLKKVIDLCKQRRPVIL